MPTTSKRFYISRADDHAVIKSVPVAVCATPQRVDLGATNDAPAAQAESAVQVDRRPESRTASSGRIGGRIPRPHLPHIGRSSR